MQVLHVISGLGPGGAERAMVNAVVRLRERDIQSAVVSVGGWGPVGDQLVAADVRVDTLGIRGPFGVVRGRSRLRRIIADYRPDIIQGWMYHGNLVAGLAGVREVPVVFGIRHSLPTLAHERWLTRLVIRLGARLSDHANAIVYNTKAGMSQHERLGYAAERGVWIPNGFDMERFKPDSARRCAVRRELQLNDQVPLIGLIARYHPIKDQSGFLRAAAVVASRVPQVRFLLVGRGVDDQRNGLHALAVELGIQDKVTFLGDRSDVSSILNALDIACLASASEGFPNVVAEAMACGVPVVATRVGDVPEILGDTGVVVEPGDALELAWGLLKVLACSTDERREESARARRRIAEKFSEQVMVDSFERLYREIGQPIEGR